MVAQRSLSIRKLSSFLPFDLLGVRLSGCFPGGRVQNAAVERVAVRPVELLPTEIVQTIFAFAVQPSSDDIALSEKELIRTIVFSCSQVCRFWRTVARGYSPLWVNAIDFQRYPLLAIQEVLQLSEPQLFDVGHCAAPFRVYRKRDLLVLHVLQVYGHRVREWNVDYCARRRIEFHHWLFNHPAPGLEAVRWTGPTFYYTHPPHHLNNFTMMMMMTPFRNTNNIRQLCLEETDLRLSHLMDLSHLSYLSVCNIPPSSQLTSTEWIGVLARCAPRLQFLTIRDATRSDGSQIPFTTHPLRLPRIRLMSLGDSGIGMVPLLDLFIHLELPAACAVNLDPLPALSSLPRAAVNPYLNALSSRLLAHFGAFFEDGRNEIPQLELVVRPYCPKYPVTFGTVREPDIVLDWSGRSAGGSKRVLEYLDDYLTAATTATTNAIFPALNIGLTHLESPSEPRQLRRLTSWLLQRATTLRITIDDPQETALQLYPSFFQTELVKLLSGMGNLTKLILDSEGTIRAILPIIQGRMLKPQEVVNFMGIQPDSHFTPILPNLEIIESAQGVDLDPGGTGHGNVAGVLLDFMAWRRQVGCPVDVVDFRAGSKLGRSRVVRRYGMDVARLFPTVVG